jgi:hypothetical protein
LHWGFEYSQCHIHGFSNVHLLGQIERNCSVGCDKWRISLDVEMDGRWFDVDVSDPFLETFFKIKELDIRKITRKREHASCHSY